MQTSKTSAGGYPENWNLPTCAKDRQTRAERIRRDISRRVEGEDDQLGEGTILNITMQRTPGYSAYDPDGAEAIKQIIRLNGLEGEVEAGIGAKQEARVQEEALCSGLGMIGKLPSAGASFLDTLVNGAAADKTGNGKLDPTSIKNIALAVRAAGITPWHNEFDHKDYLETQAKEETQAEEETGDTPARYKKISSRLTDATVLDLKMQMHAGGLKVSTEFCHETLAWLAQRNPRHPVRDYLDKLVWDRKPRLDNLLPDYFGTAETTAAERDYHTAIGSMFLIAAVRRVRKPGCKFDTMLVLEGPQGAQKSTALRTLAGDEWFTDGMDVGSGAKETIELTCGKWVIETAELAGMSKRGVNEVKQALSKQSDNARLAYGRLAIEVPRQFVMAGTTNDTQYLKDKTGNRRFWCATVGNIDVRALRKDRDQLWAEASAREQKGERIYLTDGEYDTAMAEQAKRVEDDPLDIALDELLGDFTAGVVKKADVYKALGFVPSRASSASIGGKVATWMANNNWKDSRAGGGGREYCFCKGTNPPPLSVREDGKGGWYFYVVN